MHGCLEISDVNRLLDPAYKRGSAGRWNSWVTCVAPEDVSWENGEAYHSESLWFGSKTYSHRLTVSVDWGRVHLQSLSSLPFKTGLVPFCTGEWGDEIRRCSKTSSPCVKNQYLDDFHRFPFLRLTSKTGAMLLESHLMLFWPQNGWLFWLCQNCFPIHPAWLQQ